ncbi:MAG TPA: BON domain-containing protein, partial [Chloroflexota bacterium]
MASMDVDPSASDARRGDEALADAILRELRQDSATTALPVNVRVEEGVAYLTGRVADMDDVANAEDVAGRVPGVR